jgi:hypothetical protein
MVEPRACDRLPGRATLLAPTCPPPLGASAPHQVGDSFEDVEVGNAVGAATCLIAGGGNEKPGSATGPPPGAVPTLSVSGLTELRQLLEATLGIDGNAPPEGSPLALGWQAAPGVAPATASAPGAPAAGLGFVEQLLRWGALCAASSSFPIMVSLWGAAGALAQACWLSGIGRCIGQSRALESRSWGEHWVLKLHATNGVQRMKALCRVRRQLAPRPHLAWCSHDLTHCQG